MNTFKLSITTENDRIDKVVSKWLSMSRSQVQYLLKQNYITVNSKIAKANYKVQSNDVITVSIPTEVPINVEAENIAIDIIYEDNDIVVINKESGMVVHPSVGHTTGTLVNALLYHVKNLSSGTGEVRPGIVHRIDKDTSGLLVIAKNNDAHQQLSKQLEQHKIEREYVALVHGVIANENGTINVPLKRSKKDRLKWVVQEGGKNAITHFTVLQRFNDYTLLSLKLETGRTHQIRVHMQFIGHDIVGDPIYSRFNDNKINGQLLHARQLVFNHPETGQQMIFHAPLPDFFTEILQLLDNAIE